MSTKRLWPPDSTSPLLSLACALMALPVLLPIEVHLWSRAACGALAAVAIVLLSLRSSDGGQVSRAVPLLCLPLAVASILGAACRARALDEVAHWTVLLAAALLGWTLARHPAVYRSLWLLLAGLGCAAAIQAVFQHHLIYPEQAALLRAAAPAGQEAVAPLLLRLEAGRPSGPFILPAALAGFLALSLPAGLALLFSTRWILTRVAAVGGLLIQAYALFLSHSLGGLAAASVGVCLVLPLVAPRHLRRVAMGALLAVLLLGASFVYARWEEIGAGGGEDPLSLRAGNWSAAARMIADHPLLGVGPGSFGTFYPRYMSPGMNETRYAHNSYLQLAAGWGLWILLPLGALLYTYLRGARAAVTAAAARLPAVAGAGAFLFHNLLDFTAFQPGIGVSAALLVGLSLGPGKGQGVDERGPWRPVPTRLAVAALVALALAAQTLFAWRSEKALFDAREAALAGSLEGAIQGARRSVGLRPSHPDGWAFLAEAVLAHHMDDLEMRAAGVRAADRALELDPESAILHYTRAQYHQAAGEGAEAYRELRLAHRRYPLKPLYVLPATRHPGSAP